MSDPFSPETLQVGLRKHDSRVRKQRTQLRMAARMSEAELLDQVRTLCQALGLLHYHTQDSRGSQPGYPDWHIVGPERSMFRELKTERGSLTTDQQDWLEGLRRIGHDAEVWRPRDLINGRIQRELAQLSKINVKRNVNG